MAARTTVTTAHTVTNIFGLPPRTSKPSICQSCRIALRERASDIWSKPRSRRTFSVSASQYKKSSGSPKSNRKSPVITSSDRQKHIPDNAHSSNVDKEVDAYDYSELQSAIDGAIARLKDALTKTKDAGRVSAEMIEALPVDLSVKEGGAAQKERTKVGDLASVVPKGGRMMQIFCAEEAHVKPLTSSIQSSPYSLTPQPDSSNPLLLLIPVPPATAETRQQAAVEAKKVYDKASLDVRNARGDAQKKFRKMEIQKLVIKDELHKAHKGMEDVVKKGQDEVKRVYEAGLKVLQNS